MAVSIKDVTFKRAELVAPAKLDLIVEGLDGSGKTFFGLTGPGPIAHHDLLDNGLHRALQGLTQEKLDKLELYPFEYDFQRTQALPGTEKSSALAEVSRSIWEEFVINARASVEKCRTNIIDTGGAVWELLRLARLGKLTQVLPLQYTNVNVEFKELVQVLHKSSANNIWIHRLRPLYENDKVVPGKFDRSGYGDMAFEVDAVLRLSYDEMDGLKLRFGKCANRALTGTTIVGQAQISFPQIATMIYPNSDPKIWE